VAQVRSKDLSDSDGDDSIKQAYPLHVACCNENCPNDVISLLIEQYPEATEWLSNMNVYYYDYLDEAASLPLHYYLARNKNVDIDTIEKMIKAYPESLVIADRRVACSPIHALLSNKSIDNLQDILAYVIELEGINVHKLDAEDRTILHLACSNKNVSLELFKLIFNIWPEAIRLRDSPFGRAPLTYLCSNHDSNHTTSLDILQYIISIDLTLPRERDIGGNLPLHSAVGGMPIDFCKVLIDVHPESVRIASNRNACINGNRDASELIQYMVELYPESITVRNEQGFLPIHCAASARHGRVDNIELLLKHDPDMTSKKTTDGKRQLPLHLACRYCKHPEVIQALYDSFPEAILVLDADKKVPSQLVSQRRKKDRSKVSTFFRDQYEYVTKMKDVGIMHSPDENGWLPLHHALKDNVSLGTIKLLLSKALVSVRVADDKLAFPIHIACEFSSIKVVKYLVEYDGIPIGQLDTNKDSILHYACRGGNLDVVKYLITNHSFLVASSEVNKKDELPIHMLCEAGKDKIDDCDSAEYIETIWLMLLSNPEAVMS